MPGWVFLLSLLLTPFNVVKLHFDLGIARALKPAPQIALPNFPD